MKIRNLIVALVTLFAVVGCFEDKGNYDYFVIPDIKIKCPPIPDIIPGEKAKIDYTIELPKGYTTEFTYLWSVNTVSVATTPTYDFVGKDLGVFRVGLVITDVKTGAKYAWNASLRVNSMFERGFLILSEDAGNAEMHFIRSTMLWSDGDTQPNDSLIYNVTNHNIYKDILELPITGKPVSMFEHWTKEGPNLGEITLKAVVDGKTKIIEFNGRSLKRETFVEEEFYNNDVPANLAPKDIIHSAWNSYLLNSDGVIYSRRQGSDKDFHTGFFGKDMILWGDIRRFTDLIFTFYSRSQMLLAVEKDPTTGERNFVGISEATKASDKGTSLRVPQSSTSHADYRNFEGEILFSDYFRHFVEKEGINVFMVKNDADEYVLMIGHYKNYTTSFEFITSDNINLTSKHSITNVKGMFTIKTKFDRIVYFYDDHNLYYYDYEAKTFGIVQSYPDKIIVAGNANSNVRRYGDVDDEFALEVAIAVGFADGSIEVQEVTYNVPTRYYKKVYEGDGFGDIKQIIFKLGASGYFLDNQ